MSKVYHIAVLRQATDLEGDGELRMQEAILSTVKELNQANNFDARFEALPVSRGAFYGSQILATQYAMALSELRNNPSPETAAKMNKLSLWMNNLDVPAASATSGLGVVNE